MKKVILLLSLVFLLPSAANALKIGDMAPTFALRDSSENNFFLSDYVGLKAKKQYRGIILSFFASYCEPCKHELPILNSLADKFEKKGVKIVLVGFKEDFDKITELLSVLHIDKPLVLADRYGKVGEKFGVNYLPMTFFIDGHGVVRGVIRGELLDAEKVFQEKAEKLIKSF
jgi:thiol-disulfide isomerase/thioredoxin